jgi:hypothetical protein
MPTFPGSSTDAAAAVLKREYLPAIKAQISTDTILMDRLKRADKKMFVGDKVYKTIRTDFGITHTVDAGQTDALPPRSKQGYDQASFDVKEVAHRIAFSAISLERTAHAPEGALMDIMDLEMGGARDALGQEINRQWMGDSNGSLCTINAQTNGTAVVIVDDTRFLRTGAPIVIAETVTGGDADTGEDNTIVSIDSGTQVTLEASVTASANLSFFHRRGSGTAIRASDMFGLQAIVATTNPKANNFGGIDRTASGKRFWKAIVIHNSGTAKPLTTRLMKQGLNAMERQDRRPGTKLGIATDAVVLEYGVMIIADKRYPAQFTKLDGGFGALEFCGVPIVSDKDAPPGHLFWLNTDDLFIAELKDVSFEDRDGGILRHVEDVHQFQALLYTMTQLCAQRCNTHCVIKDIKEDSATHNLV